MGRWLVVHAFGALALCGCGRLAFDDLDTLDASLGPFGPPQRINELSTTFNEDDPAVTGDELEIYFDTDRPGGMGAEDIWRATRPNTMSAWGTAEPVLELNTNSAELSPGISLDGLTLIVSRNGGSGTGLDFWQSTRSDRGSAWSPPVRIDELSDIGEDTNAQLSADGLVVWFASKRNSALVRQMWMATRTSTTTLWNAPVPVDALNVAADMYTGDPCPNVTDTRLYFIADRAGAKNIWVVDRPTPTTFGQPRPLEGLATSNAQTDPWISIDEHRLYYAQHVGGSAELYVATR